MTEQVFDMNHVLAVVFAIDMIIFLALTYSKSVKKLKVAFAALGFFSLSCFVGIVAFMPF